MTYTMSVEEAALRLGLHPRSVRRLIERNVLKGRLETTETGKAWFLDTAEVESLVKSYEARREKQARLRAASDMAADVPGQPRPTEADRGQTEDDRRVLILEQELKRERELHEKTQNELKEEQVARLEAEKGKALLEGEKLGYKATIENQRQLLAVLQDTLVRLQPDKEEPRSASSDASRRKGQVEEGELDVEDDPPESEEKRTSDTAEANPGQPGTSSDTTADSPGQPRAAAA